MGERYGNRSTIITTNLDYSEWYDLFKRKPLVDAIRINGPSLRVPKHGDKTEPAS